MRIALMIEPQQGLSYEDQLGIARLAESCGFGTFFRSDHYRSFPGEEARATTDAWAVLAGLARETDRIGLGTLVSPVTFRHPGSFAKVVTTVNEMSGGRIEVGVGAGWNEPEHRRLGLPFPPIRERADLMEDQLAILRGLWEEPDGWSFQGHQVTVEPTIFHPRPDPRPPIIVGGEGSPRSLRLAARYADEYNMSSATAETCRDAFGRLDEECRRIGRDPATLSRSAMAGLLVGEDAAEMERRVAAQVEFVGGAGSDPEAWLNARRPRWIIGTPDQALARAREFAEAGVQRLVLQDLLPRDTAMIELAAGILVGHA